MGVLLRVSFDALAKGNVFVVIPTVIVLIGLSAGPFYEGLSRDPWAIALAALIFVGTLLVLVVAIIDRGIKTDQRKPGPPGRSGKG
jgi:hypothetical protein